MADELAAISHLLRRTGYGPAPGRVESWSTYDEALDDVLAGAVDDGAEMPDPDDDELEPSQLWWLRRMASGTNPLHEKLVLFWHSSLTSSADKAGADMMVRQHNLLRRHAVGNFRELLRAIVVDAAMLVFLDAAGSDAADPNENLARELMELFALGRGHFTEDDVKAAAKVLAGRTVDWDSEAVGFDEEAAHHGTVTFLGETGRLDAAGLVDLLCDQGQCARHIAGRLHRFLAGSDPTEPRLEELAATFRDADLELLPLVEAILRDPQLRTGRHTRARLPLEWYVHTRLALGLDLVEDDLWQLDELGQLPMYPPNVAGWPIGPQWLNSGRQLLRAAVVVDVDTSAFDVDLDVGVDASDASSARRRATAALAHCGVFDASATTVGALEAAARRIDAADGGDVLLTMLALSSPEAACC